MNKLMLWFIKITGYLPHLFYFKKKVYYVNKQKQSRNIKGPALIVSNHTAIMDFALYMFVFFSRSIHVIVGEVLYQRNKLFSWFLKKIGGIKVERDAYDFNFMHTAIEILNKGGVVEIYPEGRLPLKEEKDLLPFKPSFVYIALESGVPIIPVYTNGSYAKKKRTRVLIGEAIYLRDLYDDTKTEKENIDSLCKYVQNYIIELGNNLNEITKEK